MIFLAEKEFHVGVVDDSFPMMKLWNLFDEDNLKKYNKPSGHQKGGKHVYTLGK